MADQKISELTQATTMGTADEFVILDNTAGTNKRLSFLDMQGALGFGLRWTSVKTSKYTATPDTTTTILMTDTTDFKLGLPVRYQYGGTTYYGIVHALSGNTSITIRGATLNTGSDLTGLWAGTPEGLFAITEFISGEYGDGVNDLLATDEKRYRIWNKSKSFLVGFRVVHETVASTLQPKVNVKVNDSVVSTDDSSLGPQLSTAGVWVWAGDTDGSTILIDTATYDINYNEKIEINCTAAGTGGAKGSNLTVEMLFVAE